MSLSYPAIGIAGMLGYGESDFPGFCHRENLDSWVSRTCRASSRENHWFPRLADRHLRETTGFPDLTIVIFRKRLVSPSAVARSDPHLCSGKTDLPVGKFHMSHDINRQPTTFG